MAKKKVVPRERTSAKQDTEDNIKKPIPIRKNVVVDTEEDQRRDYYIGLILLGPGGRAQFYVYLKRRYEREQEHLARRLAS